MKSLLGYIVLRTSQPENYATESLNYILSNSAAARKGFLNLLKSIDNKLNYDLTFHTQVSDKQDQSIPDLIGFDDDNDPVCIIESKFWAGLTSHQPVTYMKRFTSKTSILLFLAPAKRRESLWGELFTKCQDAKIDIELIDDEIHFILGKINSKDYLCVIDWNSLLNILETELDIAGDQNAKADLIQLRGLCDQVDQEAFLPLNSEEISPMIGKRNAQFADIVEKALEVGFRKGVYDKSGLRQSNGKYHSGRYFRINKYNFLLSFDNKMWSEIFNTPLWLNVFGESWSNDIKELLKVQKALSKLELEHPKRLFKDHDNLPVVPIKLKLGLDEQTVINSINEQINEITMILDDYYNP